MVCANPSTHREWICTERSPSQKSHLSKIWISSPRDIKTAVNTTITAPNAVTKKHMYYIRTPPKKEKHQGAQRQSQHTGELWAPMSCWPIPAPVAGRDGAVVRSAAHLQRKFLSWVALVDDFLGNRFSCSHEAFQTWPVSLPATLLSTQSWQEWKGLSNSWSHCSFLLKQLLS